MRIVRYPLPIVDYQQLQPLWPGRVLSVGPSTGITDDGLNELPLTHEKRFQVDMWCIDNDANRGERYAPILGIWIVGTGNPIDPAIMETDALFHGTVDHRRAGGGAWHVFSAVVGTAEGQSPEDAPAYGSVEEMVERIKAKARRNG